MMNLIAPHEYVKRLVTTSIGDNKLNLVPVRSTRSLRRQCAHAAVREHARRRLGDLKVPDKIVFLEKLPKGISGKIQRTALKEFEIVAA
jgi:acyl-coenzyme A synthetase/AMP-(fatty) acid ligase